MESLTLEIKLEQKLSDAFAELNIEEKNQKSVMSFLNLLNLKDPKTYAHSARVGLLGKEIAKYVHIEEKGLFYPGLLHDVGKLLIEPEITKKTAGFGEKDMKKMKKHADYGYFLLRGIHEFSAEVILRHHRFQKNYYPIKISKPKVAFSHTTQAWIDYYARLLAVADVWDSLTTRVNDVTNQRRIQREEAITIMLKENPDAKKLIQGLYDSHIF